jgi:hypothetical protein
VRDIWSCSVTELIVDPGGIDPRSKASTARRVFDPSLLPAKKYEPAPLLYFSSSS